MNLLKMGVSIIDTDYASRYFQIVDLKESYSIGKHYFGLRGSLLLKEHSEVYGEILDQNGNLVPIYLVNNSYANTKGLATLGFEITSSTIAGDLFLCLIGITRENKLVKWIRKLTAVIEYTKNDDDFGGFLELPNNIPIEVSGAFAEVDSGSLTNPFSSSWATTAGTGAFFNVRLRWLNHYNYGASYVGTQSHYIGTRSQGSASSYFQTPPTLSEITQNTLKNINSYQVFLFSPAYINSRWSAPPSHPNYYPGVEDKDANQSGTWYWIGTIPVPYGTASASSTYIYYTIPNLPTGKPYYFYMCMTTPYTLDRWENNRWETFPKGIPKHSQQVTTVS